MTTTNTATLPDPGVAPVSTVIYTRAENQVNMVGADVTVLIDGADVVLKSPDGKTLILPLAAELASYEQNLYTLKFADGRVLTSDDVLRLGKVVNIDAATTAAPASSASAAAAAATDPKVVEKVVETVVEEIVVVEQETPPEPSSGKTGEGGQQRVDALSLTKPTEVRASDDDAPLKMASSSGSPPEDPGVPETPPPEPPQPPPPPPPPPSPDPSDPSDPADPSKPTDPVDPIDPIDPVDPVDPVDPTNPVDPGPVVDDRSMRLYQLDAKIDSVNHVYRGGAATQGAQTDPTLALQYGTKTIDLSTETADWTVYADDPARFSPDMMTRVIHLMDAAGRVHISRGLPTGYRVVEYGTAEGRAYGLNPGDVLLLYPKGRQDSLALTFEYHSRQGGPLQEHHATFVIMDNPYEIQREDGSFALASTSGPALVNTGSGNDTIYAGSSPIEIHAGAGNDRIVASTVRGVYDGGTGEDTVDYSGFAAGITVDLRNGVTTLGGKAIHTLIDIDAIVGTGFDDVLIAGTENAKLYGGAGNDVFFSGAGQNLLSGGEGRDVVDYSQATQSTGVHASLAAGRTEAGRNGYGGTDTYEGIEGLIGSRFDDTLEGDAGDNTIFAGEGDDTIIGSAGSDVLDGGLGRNTLDYSKLDVALTINLITGAVQKTGGGADQISNFVEVFGGSGNDTLHAVSGSVLHGGQGDDTFIGTLGSTTLDGGEGRDLVDYSALNQALYVDLQTGFASTLTTAYVNGSMVFRFNDATAFGRDTLTDIEDVYASFSAGTNYLLGSAADNHMKGGRYINYFDGADGNNTLDGTAGTSDYALYASSSGAVTAFLNAAGNGTVTHGSFTDTLTAFEGIWGSDYDDILTAENARTLLFGGRGNDTLTGGTAYYTWGATQGIVLDLGGGGNAGVGAGHGIALNDGYGTQDQLINVNNVTGTYGFNDTIWGNDNNNIITEVNGNNYIYGSKGNDTLSLGTGNNTVDYSLLDRGINANLSTTVQTIGKAEYGSDRVSGVRNITGTALADTIIGSNDNNTLIGNGGADVLVGNGGNDVLIGGADGLATASYHTSPQGIDANLSSGQVQDGFGSFDTLVQIGKIVGSSKGDRFTFSNQGDLSRYQIDGGAGGNDVMVKQGAGGSFSLDASVHISHISTIDFADGKTDRVSINLNELVSGPASSSMTIRLDAQDSFNVSQTGWTMTENTADHQTWSQGGHTVIVTH